MSALKKEKRQKISRNREVADEHPIFSFRYLTKNKHYNYEYFDGDISEERDMSKALMELLAEFGNSSYVELLKRPKATGFETIECSLCRVDSDRYRITPDQKFYVARFANQKYRMLGIKDDRTKLFYIIGFDFDHSAYNHG